ncbi:uncharacterized protein C5orf49 homolog isoform X2 [Sturnira hondurensis]|uniref:uncharacterized protein C5orf49 homolog isoform X2 n=1 Tax=Sturnira hondurensis TaxID=192404 RepID=UPI001879EF4F|nr:uncharacterized protein C5orf49 homolog isoform X2 [Sturnira hondurensis]
MADDDEEEEITADTLRCKPRVPPISAQSAFGYIPPRRQDPKEHSYYYRQGKSKHSASGRAIWAPRGVCRRVTGTSPQRLQRTEQRTHTKNEGQSCSQKVHRTFLKTQSSCQNEDDSSGSQVALGKGP